MECTVQLEKHYSRWFRCTVGFEKHWEVSCSGLFHSACILDTSEYWLPGPTQDQHISISVVTQNITLWRLNKIIFVFEMLFFFMFYLWSWVCQTFLKENFWPWAFILQKKRRWLLIPLKKKKRICPLPTMWAVLRIIKDTEMWGGLACLPYGKEALFLTPEDIKRWESTDYYG